MTTRLLALRQGSAPGTVPPVLVALDDMPTLAGATAIAMGSVVLAGWFLDADILKSMLPGLLTMKANTAVCFVLMGFGMVLLRRSADDARGRPLGRALVGAAATITLITGTQFVTGADLGIDQMLFREAPGEVGTVVVGRMSPLTAICFLLLATAALGGARRTGLVMALCVVALMVSVLNVLNYVFDAEVPPFLMGYTQMALSTAVAMGILAVGVIGLLGAANPFAVLDGPSATAVLLRRVLLVLVAVPVLTAWLSLDGQRAGLYDAGYGTSLRLVVILTLGIIAILRSGRWAREMNTKRDDLEFERDQFFELSVDMLSVVGADGRFRRVNGAWQSVLGYAADELVGRPFLDLVHPADLDRTVAESRRHHEIGDQVEPFHNRYRHRNGDYRWLEWMSQTAPDGSVTFAVARDITDRKGQEDRRARQQRMLEVRNETLNERTIRDSLTGLHNRRYFDAEVGRMERRWRRAPVDERPPVSVIMFDLDNFGQVNKQHGHQAGDAVLRLFSSLLRRRFREIDLVARYGGEEFVAVLEGTSRTQAIRIAEEIRVALEGTSVDIGNGTPLRVSVSAGTSQLGDEGSIAAGLAVADVGLSQAKRAGRNQVVGL